MRGRKITLQISLCLVLLLLAMSLVMACPPPDLLPPPDSTPVPPVEEPVEPVVEEPPVEEPAAEPAGAAVTPGPANILEAVCFKVIDQHALAAPAWAEVSIEALASHLVGPARNELEKTRAIFRWIAYNITYDMEGFRAGVWGKQSAETVLASRKAVCDGYARLFKALAHLAGLEVVHITGWVREEWVPREGPTPLQDPNYHAWNAVRIDGGWYLLDTTWADGDAIEGQLEQRLEEFYFLTPQTNSSTPTSRETQYGSCLKFLSPRKSSPNCHSCGLPFSDTT